MKRRVATALVIVLALGACGDGEDSPESDDEPAAEITSSPDETGTEPAATAEPAGQAALGTYSVNGDSYTPREILLCDTAGLFDLIVFGEQAIHLFIEVDEAAGDWTGRINGKVAEETYGHMTYGDEISGDYELTAETISGSYVLADYGSGEEVTVDFNIAIPTERTADCPKH